MRVVVDTNILVSFAIRPSEDFTKLFNFLSEYGLILVSEETIAELSTVLNRDKFKKYIPQKYVVEYIDWYIGISERITVTEHLTACRDPKDDKFLSLAVAGNADYIIAGDDDLLDMNAYRGIPIYRTVDFLKLFT